MSAWGSSAVSRFRKTLKPSTRLYLRRCQYFPLMFQILTIPRYLIPQSSSQAFYLPLLRKRHSYRREAFLKATKSFARLPQIPYAIARPRTVTRFLTRASATHSHMSGDVCNIYSMKANSGEEVPASNGSEDLHSPDDRTADQNGGVPISKRQQKKLLKKQAAKQNRQEKKAMKKEESKAKAAAKRKEMDERVSKMTAEEREAYRQKAHAASQERVQSKARQKERLKEAMLTGQHIIIDLDFATEMTQEQVVSLCQQLSFCHSVNAAAATPVHLELASMGGTVGRTLRSQVSGVDNWPVTSNDEAYLEKYSERKQDLVYLSADSEEVLKELDPQKIYIIGGLVDRNRHKGICEGRAKQHGIKTARLPIDDHVKLTGNKVLTVNQVFAMLVEWVATEDWFSAVEKALPQRKVKDGKRKHSPSDQLEEPVLKTQKVENQAENQVDQEA